MNDALSKPVVPDRLYAAVARQLHATAAEVEAVAETAAPPAEPEPCAPSGDPNVIDLSILAGNVRGTDKVRKYALMFVESMSVTLDEMDAALRAEDLLRLSDLGHRAKSSAATVGAMGIRQQCLALQQLQHGGSIEQAREIVAALAPLFQQVREVVGRAFRSPPG